MIFAFQYFKNNLNKYILNTFLAFTPLITQGINKTTFS